jgi:uncharacterized protein
MLDAATHATLREFAAVVRQPDKVSANPRLAVYQRLFFSNIHALLTSAFPVTQALLGPHWRPLSAAFYAAGCAQPRFTELAPELIQFVSAAIGADSTLPWPIPGCTHPPQAVLELLHYEWIETELVLSNAAPPNVPAGQVQLSPLARPLAYQFAVHEISAANPPPTQPPEQASYLLVWRNAAFQVKFQTLSAAAMALLMRFQTPQALTARNANEAPLLDRWLDAGVLLSESDFSRPARESDFSSSARQSVV